MHLIKPSSHSPEEADIAKFVRVIINYNFVITNYFTRTYSGALNLQRKNDILLEKQNEF